MGVRSNELLCGFMLLKFGKFKKSLNSFNDCRSFVVIFLIRFFFTFARWSGNIIDSPSTDKVFQFTPLQIPTKSIIGSCVFDTCGFNYVVSGTGLKPQHSQFILERGYKVSGGLVKIISPGNVFAEEMSSKTADENAKNTKSASNICYFKGSKFQFNLMPFLAGL